MKTCSKCLQDKCESEFGVNNKRCDKLDHYCKICRKEYRASQKTTQAIYWSKYYSVNKSQILESKKSLRDVDSDRAFIHQHKKNIHKIFKRLGSYKSIDRYIPTFGCTVSELIQHLNNSAIINGYPDFDICDYDSQKYHIDHIIPFKKYLDGCVTFMEVNHYKNLQVLTSSENLIKGDR